MNRWVLIARIFGIVMLIVFVALMIHLQRKLNAMRENPPTATSTSR